MNSEGGIDGFQDGRSLVFRGNPVYRERTLHQEEDEIGSDDSQGFTHAGETKEAFFERVYDELHGLASRQMRNQAAGHTLQATALVSELYLKLERYDLDKWQSRSHFVAMAARTMRSILVDHSRNKNRQKRTPRGGRVALDEAAAQYEERSGDLVALDEALVDLAEKDPVLVELVELRFFGGCSMEECATMLGRSLRTVHRDWRFAKDWLRRRLGSAYPERKLED